MALMQKFPAYKYEDLDDAPIQLWTGYRLLGIADNTQSGKR